jgi:GNAT superfamily N-acetyltransferase
MREIVEIGEEGLERFVAIRNAIRTDDPTSVEDYRDWRSQAEDMGWWLAVEDGADSGAGIVLHGWHSAPGVGRLSVFVPDGRRGRGNGTALFETLCRWLRGRGCAEAISSVREDDETSLAWAARRGFVEVGRNSVLALDLDGVKPLEPAPPNGVEIVTWAERPELARGMYEVYCESAPDIPGEEEELPEFEAWLANDMQGLSDRPEATFVALAGEDVVAYAKLAISGAGCDVAWHDLTGVRRAWRGRGIAGALKRSQINWARANGFRFLRTHNEERNEPVQRLNRRHGYVPEPGSVTVRGPVS